MKYNIQIKMNYLAYKVFAVLLSKCVNCMKQRSKTTNFFFICIDCMLFSLVRVTLLSYHSGAAAAYYSL